MALSSLTSEIRMFRLNKEGNRVIFDLEIKGATDRRLARLNVKLETAAQLSQDRGGYFCALLSLPIEYPIPKQVKPKLNTAISPKISMAQPSFLQIPFQVSM
jgi:hypothetical protein